MNIFISGGVKNGKSYFAQVRAKEIAEKAGFPLYYIATMIPADDEDRKRIENHIAARDGWGFITIEQGRNIVGIIEGATGGNSDSITENQVNPTTKVDVNSVFLLDSVTALLANEMFTPKGYIEEAGEKVKKDLLDLISKIDSSVIVSDYIYGDPGPFDEMTENYIRSLADIDRALSKACDQVYEITAGESVLLKGEFNEQMDNGIFYGMGKFLDNPLSRKEMG